MKRTLTLIGVLVALTANAQLASWYGEEHRGKLTASGERFNPDLMTAASWKWPMHAYVAVTYGRSTIIVRINDRGPNKRFNKRGIDLSYAAFRKLADPDLGLIKVKETKWNSSKRK